MTNVHTAHTSELGTTTLKALRAMLDEAFEGDFDASDWDHTLGGMHALAWEDDELIGHGAVVQRRLLHAGRTLRTGYLEGVAVRADRRGAGLGAAVMEALERVIRGAYELGALSASQGNADFYTGRGWQPWLGPTSVLTPAGIERTESDDGNTYVLPLRVPFDRSGDLVCDWREGDVW